jgi:lactate dehydrogenase-like 2-hydroxyacid dehydrogenase
MGAGYDNIDLAACAARGVGVSNIPDAWVEEVADSAMAHALGLIRRTSYLSSRIVANSGGGGDGDEAVWWTNNASLPTAGIRRIRGLRFGIVGLGRIGTAVAQRSKAFGFRTSFYDPHVARGMEKGAGGVGRCYSFPELLSSVDIISFHCPLNADTAKMLDADALRNHAQNPIYVINCARGGVVDDVAVAEGLQQGSILGAGLDCLQTEPRVSRELLQAARDGFNVTITPHSAFYSDEAFEEMRYTASSEIARGLGLSGLEPPCFKVN